MAKSKSKKERKVAPMSEEQNSSTVEAAAPVAAAVLVENPVNIAVKIIRTSEYKGKARWVTTYEPAYTVPAAIAEELVKGLNKSAVTKPDSKTTREFVVMPAEGKNSVPVITEPDFFLKSAARQAKRDFLKAIPGTHRTIMGFPSHEATDAVIDAWDIPTAPAAE